MRAQDQTDRLDPSAAKVPLSRPGAKSSQKSTVAQLAHAMQSSAGNQAMAHAVSHSRTPVQRTVGNVMEDMTVEQLRQLLPSYNVDAADVEAVVAKFNARKGTPLAPTSVQDLLSMTFPAKYPRDEVEKGIKKNLTDSAPSRRAAADTVVTLHRGDSRSKEEVEAAGGFFGWGPVTVEHARSLATAWQAKNAAQRRDWFQHWKAETAAKQDDLPYVATGSEAQKGGHHYTLNVPLKLVAGEKEPGMLTPTLWADKDDPSQASVLALESRGEYVFITGVPLKYVSGLKPPVPEKSDSLKAVGAAPAGPPQT
ncbi:hypothetical protein ACIQFU_30995 [Streptomyces sp. NPDC093065]|uniref:hypothetical protein n=1 Tax=Streptomyces sp. NPDC093065 TaxID=3366021 RepID=UPI0038123B00